jgi:hypothetical protein
MKTFEEQNAALVEFDKTFNSSDFESCVSRAILLLKNREAQMTEEGFEFNFQISKWSIEQAIINRSSEKSMMQATIEYVENVESEVEAFNGI